MSSSEEEVSAIIERVSKSQSHYETLGVSPQELEEKVLKKAYRKLALQLHPDKCHIAGAEEAFKKVSSAYSCLSSPESRAHYDRFGSDGPPATGGGVDPNEFFRDFMAQNPDFAAGFQAGDPNGTFNVADFDFGAGTLAAGRSWWATKTETLPGWLQGPFRAVGVVLFAIVQGFFATMPYSAMAMSVVVLCFAIQAVWWILNRGIWVLALSYLPSRVRPPFVLQIAILVGAEYLLGVVFDFQRGLPCFLALWAFQRFTTSSGQQPGRHAGFSFGPGFVQFGGPNNSGGRRVGGGAQRH